MNARRPGTSSVACLRLPARGALALAALAGCSVDGVTPDCADVAVCAPSAGDASAPDDAGDGGARARDAGADGG